MMQPRSLLMVIAMGAILEVGCGGPSHGQDKDGSTQDDGALGDGASPDAQSVELEVTISVDPLVGVAPLPVALGATATGGTAPYGFSWTFGDGEGGEGASVSHLFEEGGAYPVQVTVTDAQSRSATALYELPVQNLPDGIVPLGISAETQDIQADENGTVHILWVGAGNQAYYSTIENDAVGTPEPVVDGVTRLFTFPRLAVSSDGQRVHTAYVGPNAMRAERVFHVERTGPGVFSAPEVVLDEVTADVFYAQPAIAVDLAGSVHIIAEKWADAGGSTYIMYTSRPVGGVWADEHALVDSTGEVRDCALHADRLGGLHASWSLGAYRYAAQGEDLRESTTTEIPAATDAPRLFFGDFSSTPSGRVHKVSQALNPTTHQVTVEHSLGMAGGPFSLPSRPSLGPVGTEWTNQGTDWMPDAWPAVGEDALGRIFVAWGQPHKTTPTELVVSVWAFGEWHLSVLDAATGLTNHNKPSIAVTDSAVIIVWRNDDGQLLLRRILL